MVMMHWRNSKYEQNLIPPREPNNKNSRLTDRDSQQEQVWVIDCFRSVRWRTNRGAISIFDTNPFRFENDIHIYPFYLAYHHSY